MQSKVSVVLPFYNSQNTIEDAIKSILNQSFDEFELILINNNSTDNSGQIANDYAVHDDRIVLVDEPMQGIAHALNTGLEIAKSPIIARMDADDTSMPERLEKQVQYLDENPDVGVVGCCVRHVAKDDEQQGMLNYVIWSNKLLSAEEIKVNRFVESPVVHPSVCFRRELVEKYGGYKQGFFPEDYEFWLRLLENDVIIHKLPDYLLEWYDYPERLSRTDDRYNSQAFFEMKSQYLFNYLKEKNGWFPNVAVWGAGRISRRRFSYLHELGIWPKFFIDLHANEPKNVIQFKHTPPAGNHFILSYVSNYNARNQIKEFLTELGYIEGEDFLCVA